MYSERGRYVIQRAKRSWLTDEKIFKFYNKYYNKYSLENRKSLEMPPGVRTSHHSNAHEQ